ncbi:MAG: gluconate 2-dehydrogenase subunit 3 family protein [Terriglobia bacterium]|nr:gluconate 2-dehydrogenase subunit 3 family protein [Terriglobia bacterium]
MKAIVAVPVTATSMFGQTTTAPSGEKTSAPQTSSTSTVPPADTAPRSIDQRGSFGFQSPVIPATVPDAIATTEGHFFDARQMATLRKLGDILLPPLDGYPGSAQASAPEFIDFLISVSPAERQHMYRSGLDQLNADAEKRFAVPFADVNAEQADALLRPWLRVWMRDHPPAEPFAQFINLAHEDIRTATMNSQIWSIAATSAGERAPGIGLYWSPIDPDIEMYV